MKKKIEHVNQPPNMQYINLFANVYKRAPNVFDRYIHKYYPNIHLFLCE